jgi:serine protease
MGMLRWLHLSTICALLVVAGAALAGDQPRSLKRNSDPDATDRIIVKFRASPAAAEATETQARIAALGLRSGRALQLARSVSETMHSVRLDRLMSGAETRAIAAQLARDPAVEYAVPDRRRFVQATPNDPLYGTGDGAGMPIGSTPIAQQWYLVAPTSTLVASINAEQAWDLSNGTGAAGAPVAVVDTGVLFDHPDLGRTSSGGKLLAGYDFIQANDIANDGGGRDSDPSDPGDWISSADLQNSTFEDCDVADSSWHGTHIAALIGARTNNSSGGTGVGWNTPVLPLRVLGKCFGNDSDILAAIRWAAGLTVSGVVVNPNPVRVVNLSLGGPATPNGCAAYESVASELASIPTGGVIVVAAGGNTPGPVHEPARCNGVLGVGGLRHNGTKVGFSSFGSQIGVSAPAGNCINSTGACLRPIVSASNTGTQAPSPTGMGYAGNLGTSFSAPMVAGVAALMLARNSNLSLTQLRDRLTRSARQFPVDLTLMNCDSAGFVPDSFGEYPNGGSCNCTASTCGGGMLDAHRAARSATEVLPVITGPATATVGQATNLSGASSLPAPTATAIAMFAWSSVSGPATPTLGATNTSTLSFTASTAGTYVVRLTVTDDGASPTTNSVDHTIVVANAGAPTITSNPVDTTARVGTDAIFSVTASGVGISAYQWQRSSDGVSWSNISNANGDTYTLTNVLTSDNGARFRVRVSNSVGTSDSASARLTVTSSSPTPPRSGGGGALGFAALALVALGLAARRR